MILKFLSIPELNFYESWKNGWEKIHGLSKTDKYMTIFWFLGPFIYLIERDPADLWLSLISLFFLARCIKRKNWSWTSQIWFKSALALWVFGLFSAITSPDPLFTFQQGFVWIRFPLYAAAAQVWLAKDRDIRVVMLLSMVLGMLIMCGILIAESIIEPKIRLTWPYGDMVPGAYVAKFSLPILCIIIALAFSEKNKIGFVFGFLSILAVYATALTGERNNLIILICSGVLAGFVWKPRFVLYSSIILINIIAVSILVHSRPDLSKRYGEQFINKIPIINTSDSNAYWGAWRGGIQQGLITPIKGAGPSGTRNTCATLDTNLPEWLPGKNYCGNHPHNFYVQLLAETGIIGLFFGCLMFGSIIWTCFKNRKENFDCPMAATAFIIPFGLFFPMQQFGSFYGQWGNLFTWFAIGFAVSQVQSYKKIQFK